MSDLDALIQHVIIAAVLPPFDLNDTLRLRKPHPCGSTDWKVVRMGADIGLECLRCGRRILLDRRTLSRRLKLVIPPSVNQKSE